MERLSLVSSSLLLLLLFTTVRTSMGIGCEWVQTRYGGCPGDVNRCREKCRRCFKGVGHIIYGCFSKGSGQPNDECRCYFIDGAVCDPDCLRGDTISAANPGGSALGFAYYNGTHHIIASKPNFTA